MTKNQIIEALFTGKNFNDCLGKMEPAHLREDLKQEVILIMCELPDEKVLRLHEDNALEFYTVRVIINQIRSKTSPFAKKFRRINLELTDHETIEPPDLKERMLKEELEDYTLAEIDSLYWYDAELIRLYMEVGTFRAIEKRTRIPYASCYKTIQKALGVLRRRMSLPPHERPTSLFSRNEINQIKR